jgi:hypothetical protein
MPCVILAAAVLLLSGCSKEALQRTGYETLHNISDSKNDIDPGYDADRPAFDEYERQQEQILRGQPPNDSEKCIPRMLTTP